VGSDVDYVSGEDYVVEFLGYRFGFNARDFQERVTAASRSSQSGSPRGARCCRWR